MMIDTIKLVYKIKSKKSRDLIYKAISNLTKGTKNPLHLKRCDKTPLSDSNHWKKIYITTAFYSYGVLELAIEDIRHRSIHNGGSKTYFESQIVLKYKPALALYKDAPYQLSEAEDYFNAEKNLDCLIHQFRTNGCEDLPSARYWEVTRVDYAFTLKTPYYRQYMILLRKGCSKEQDIYNSSVYIKGKNRNINFYDKTLQLGSTDDLHHIRFEVQCKSNAISRFKKKFNLKTCTFPFIWKKSLAKKAVCNKIKQLIGKNDFYSLEYADSILGDTFRTNKKAKLMDLLKISCHPRVRREKLASLYAQREEILTKSYVERSLIGSLEDMDVNRLALPCSWNLDFLPNPYRLIQTAERSEIHVK